MNTITVRRATAKGKKFKAELPDGRTVSFGQAGASDFTKHKDPARKASYLARHKHDPRGIDTAGFWARELLWSKPSLPEAAAHVGRLTKKKVVLKI